MIEGEQQLQQLGVRDIVAGLGSANVTDFQNGMAALKRVFVTQYDEGFNDGQHNALSAGDDIRSRAVWAGIIVGAVGGVALTSIYWMFLA